MNRRTKIIRIRTTAEEHTALAALAAGEASVSAFARKQLFGRQSETALRLVRIHGIVQQIARALSQDKDSLGLVQVLAHLLAVERALTELLNRGVE